MASYLIANSLQVVGVNHVGEPGFAGLEVVSLIAPLRHVFRNKDNWPAIGRGPAEADRRAGIHHLCGKAQGIFRALAAHDAPDLTTNQLYGFDIEIRVIRGLVTNARHHADFALLQHRNAEQAGQGRMAGGKTLFVRGVGIVIDDDRHFLTCRIGPDACFGERVVVVERGRAVILQCTARPGSQFDGLAIDIDEVHEGNNALRQLFGPFQRKLHERFLGKLLGFFRQFQQNG